MHDGTQQNSQTPATSQTEGVRQQNGSQTVQSLPKSIHKIPYFIGLVGGYWFDMLSWITGKNLRISSVRIKKFCATTQFDSTLVNESGFEAPFTLQEGLERTLQYEFISQQQDKVIFETE